VNGLWLDIQHPLATSRGTAAGLLDQEGHREALIQNTKLSVLGLAISRVAKDASVEHGAMNIGHHRSNVAGRVRGLFGVLRELERVEILGTGCIPVFGVALVDSVDLPAGRNLNLRMIEKVLVSNSHPMPYGYEDQDENLRWGG